MPKIATIRMIDTAQISKPSMKLTRRPMPAKNSGAKMLLMNCSMVSRVLALRCFESPMATPAMKAPKIEWMPIASVAAAQMSETVSTKPRTPPGQELWA